MFPFNINKDDDTGTTKAECSQGQYSSGGACHPCPVGYYKPGRGQELCKPCPEGETTPSEGATSPKVCTSGMITSCRNAVDIRILILSCVYNKCYV